MVDASDGRLDALARTVDVFTEIVIESVDAGLRGHGS
jgi:hypothetical protein